MSTRISLGGDWQFKGYLGEEWIWNLAVDPKGGDKRWWYQGSVPGSVHHDLWKAGQIPDPYFERNSLLIEWAAQRTWVYKRDVVVPGEYRGKRARLVFEGVDYEAEFYLNGELLGCHTGMYIPVAFEVGDKLQYDEPNLLAVVIRPAPAEQPQVGRTSRVRTHKSRMTYWWDFCPRMVHLGIWDEVYLKITGDVAVEDVWVRPQLADGLGRADVTISTEISARLPVAVDVQTTIRYAGQVLATSTQRQELAAGSTRLEANLEVTNPRLWWPNGHGDQPLYQAEVRVVVEGSGSEDSDRKVVEFGIRQVRLLANDTSDDTARPYTLEVNNRRIYIKGWNWVPIDVLYGVPRGEKLERLLTLAKRAHVNLLRVWGGGLIEKEAFYDACDRHGIMVWQEFIQSSSGIDNKPSEDPHFIEMMVSEAEQIVPRRRNHASLVIWCGGNELTAAGNVPLDDTEPVLGALKSVVERLDPDRHWLPTSPSGPTFGNSIESIERDPLSQHDVHGPWEHQGLTGQYALYNAATSLLHSEFGVEGVTNLKSLYAQMSEEVRWPVSRDNPYWFHTSSWWIKDQVLRGAFGEFDDLPTLARASQFLQADGLRYAVEANRRRKYRNSGTLPWQFNEPYPNAACTSAVDYHATPKPAYYAVTRAYEPVHVSARFDTQVWDGRSHFEAEVWASSSQQQRVEAASLEIRLVGASGTAFSSRKKVVSLAPECATRLDEVRFPISDVHEEIFFLDLHLRDRAGEVLSANRYLFSRAANLRPMLDAPPSTLEVEKEAAVDNWQVHITNSGLHTALLLCLEDACPVGATGYAYFDDNHFCLFPGESRMVLVEWCGVAPQERQVELSGWNTGQYAVE